MILGMVIGTRTTEVLVSDPGYHPGNQSGVEQVLTRSFPNVSIKEASSARAVAAAFGANGARMASPYAVGLVVPANFEASLRAGERPALRLYVNGDDVDRQQSQLLQSALADYSGAVMSQAPLTLDTHTINPPPPDRVAAFLAVFDESSALFASYFAGMALVPGLLIEEKEKKTLRMLLASQASWADVIAAKLLVAFGYQLLLSLLALALVGGFAGQVPLVLVAVALGSLLSVALGALAGCFFTSKGSSCGAGSIAVIILLPVLFSDQLGVVGSSPVTPIVKVLPTSWLGDALMKAVLNQATMENTGLDVVMVLGSTLLLFLLALWGLRRQASVVSTI
jgi:ABC-2 type transport system permease protein